MKKIFLLLVLFFSIFSLFGCENSSEKYQYKAAFDKVSYKYEDVKEEEYLNFLNKVSVFSSRITELIYENNDQKNFVISPISIYMALAMAVESSDGSTQKEILEALGLSYEEVSKYTKILYSLCNKEYTTEKFLGKEKVVAESILTNSIWVDNDIELINIGMEKLAENYNTDSYRVPFKDSISKANKAINDYISDKTKGLIDSLPNLDEETLMVLLNTFYFKEIWNDDGDELKLTSQKYDFTSSSDIVKKVSLLMGKYVNGKAYEDEKYTHFFTTTEHNYKISFIVPKENYSVKDIFLSENLVKIINMKDYKQVDEEKKEQNFTRCFFPEYEAEFDGDIKNELEKMGISRLFTPDCSFGNITNEWIYCNRIIHKTKLKVDRTGILGASITALEMPGAADPGEYKKVYYDYIVDRSFGFLITNPNGVVIFSGVINDI